MTDGTCPTAEQLRRRFKKLPARDRQQHPAFTVRLWRGLSWLARAQEACDTEGRFISLWIAFNAAYGHPDRPGRSARDHSSWQEFLAHISDRDAHDRLGGILQRRQMDVLKLIDNHWLFKPYWLGLKTWKRKLDASRRWSMTHLNNGNTNALLQELFERLYVLRQQVFHGAATSGSRLNREYLTPATELLAEIVPTVLSVMLDAGCREDWGELCFPPIPADEHPEPNGASHGQG
jgi:hypothetical protein